MVCLRCSKKTHTLLAGHCVECYNSGKVGTCEICHVAYNFFSEFHGFSNLPDKFDFVCDKCKCLQCKGTKGSLVQCFSCKLKTCVDCIGNIPKSRYVCINCRCKQCSRPAKADCETKQCKVHCSKADCKAHSVPVKKRGKDDEDEDSSSSVSLNQVTIRLLTLSEKIKNDPKAREAEQAFRVAAIDKGFGICMHYFNQWQVELNRIEKMKEEKKRLKEQQTNEFKKLRPTMDTE